MICRMNTLPSYNGTCLSGYIRSYGEMYGMNQPFLQIYGDENENLLSIMDGTVTVCWNEYNLEELSLFLQTQSWHTLRATVKAAAYLSAKWGNAAVLQPVMRYVGSAGEVVESNASPREVYPFLASVFDAMPPFDVWYTDVCYRVRHGFCRICAVKKESSIVSSAMTVAEWENGAVLGAVATDKQYRRQGYAGRCVMAVVSQLNKSDVFICPKTQAAERLYEQLGFVVCDEIGKIER